MNRKTMAVAVGTALMLGWGVAGVSPAAAALLAEDDFTGVTTPAYLSGMNSGTGWQNAWFVQNFPGNYDSAPQDSVPDQAGYEVRSDHPLSYPLLVNSAPYAVGGHKWEGNLRYLDTTASGPFGAAGLTTSTGSGDRIGAPGSVLWVSFLTNRHNNQSYYFTLNNDGYYDGNNVASVRVASGKWTLSAGSGGANTDSGVSANLDQTYLMVLHLAYGVGTTDVSLYVDPDLSVGQPASPALTLTTSASTVFDRIAFYPGDGFGSPPPFGTGTPNGSIDAIRFGQTFADVTPMVPEPASLGLLGLGGLMLLGRRRS